MSTAKAPVAAVLTFLLLSSLEGCGGGQKSSTNTSSPGKTSQVRLTVSGGHGDASGSGGDGGDITLLASGGFGKSDGSIAGAPPAGTELTQLSDDVTTPGDVTISGTVAAGGAGPVRSIDAGNITISGMLRSGPGIQEIDLKASGDIYVSGTIDASGTGSATAGSVSLTAAGKIIVTSSGKILASGLPGGSGGTLRIDQAATAILLGTFDAQGGDGASGGAGGKIAVTAGIIEGGWDTIVARGGDGGKSGGQGGTVTVASFQGGTSLWGTWDAGGGLSGGTGGKGGQLNLTADLGGGDLTSDATLLAEGGSASAASSAAAGGEGGAINLSANFDPSSPSSAPGATGGSITLSSGSILNVNGGQSTGQASAGAGGRLYFQIPQEHVALDGQLSARGGDARGSGPGGTGGMVWVASDLNGNATGGDVTLLSTGVVDASGGDSASGQGGDARWSANPWVISDTNPKAVLFDSDNISGGGIGGFILNKGVVRARGGKHGGHGGDVEFHGLGTWDNQGTGELNPLPGTVENKGDSAGDGAFVSD